MDRDRQTDRQLKRDRLTREMKRDRQTERAEWKEPFPHKLLLSRTSQGKRSARVFFSPSVYDVVNGLASLEEAEGEAGTFPNQTIFVLQQLHQPRHSVIMALACPACNTTRASV